MYYYERKICGGVETIVVAFALFSVEFQFGYVASHIVWTYVAHISETFRYSRVFCGEFSLLRHVFNHINWHGIGKIGTVCPFKHAKLHSRRTAIPWRVSNFGYYVFFSQIESHPSVTTVVGCEKRVEIIVKNTLFCVYRCRRIACGVVHRVCRTDNPACKRFGLRFQRQRHQEKYGESRKKLSHNGI